VRELQTLSDPTDAEQELRATQARHSAVLDATFDAIVTMDQFGRIVDFNGAAERAFGYRREDAVGQRVSDLLVPPNMRDAHERGLRRHLETGEAAALGHPLELSALRADGSEFDVELTINRIDLPDGPLFTASIRDVSERRAAERKLRAAEQRYRSLVEQLPLVVYVDEADADCTNLYTSPQTEEMLGYTPGDWADTGLFERILHPDDRERVLTEMASEVAIGGTVNSEYRLIARDGRTVWIRDASTAICDVDGTPIQRQGYLLDITSEREARDELERLAYSDPLTGLWNRTMLERVLAEHGGEPGPTLLFLDLDDFKTVNDSLGHAAGDELLRTIAGRLRQIVRPTDVVARIGGDEFAVLVERGDPTSIADRIVAALRLPIAAAGHELIVTASIGIAAASEPAEMLRHADMAMYDAKNAGGGTYRFFEQGMHEAVVSRLALLRDLARPSFLDELFVDYQPIFDLESGRVAGVEALCRWRHPRRGLVGPAEFLGVAEENGRIVDIGRHVLGLACEQGAAWSRRSEGLSISVNVAARQLADPDFADDVARALAQTGLEADRLVLELTETALMRGDPITNANLLRLKELGTRIAIDDFGTGYSSLAYLARMQIDVLKIDRSFVEDCDLLGGGLRLIETITRLGQGLGLSVVAEGVERETQLERLRTVGCDGVQGFLLGRPVSPEDVDRLLDERLAARRLRPLRAAR
jgi:diguanylate cyclase (GGDEF)-like protein/PAS domain S-box-containing protein